MDLINFALDTNDLKAAHLFYVRQLGLPVLSHSGSHLSLLISNTRLTFRKVKGIITPYHVSINVLPDSLTVFMYNYELHYTFVQTPEKRSTCRPERQPGRHHFYDPMGNLIELIPQMYLTLERQIVNPCAVRQLEAHPVLLCA